MGQVSKSWALSRPDKFDFLFDFLHYVQGKQLRSCREVILTTLFLGMLDLSG